MPGISGRAIVGAAALILSAWVTAPSTEAANIITFDDNANGCGGSVMCSTNGTTGYLDNGTGVAFDLSTITQWFQIDPNNSNSNTSENYLASQSMGEPDGGAGGFRVLNDTGATVTSFSIALTDTFTSQTPSVTFCSSSSGPVCDSFQDNEGAAAPSGATETLSGPDLYAPSCSGTVSGNACSNTSGGNVTAEFEPGTIIYTWNGLDIAKGAYFDIDFASWQQNSAAPNGAYPTPAPVPEPGSLSLFISALAGFGSLGWLRRRRAAE